MHSKYSSVSSQHPHFTVKWMETQRDQITDQSTKAHKWWTDWNPLSLTPESSIFFKERKIIRSLFQTMDIITQQCTLLEKHNCNYSSHIKIKNC